MSNTYVPLISSGIAGPLGIVHLPRLWQKVSLNVGGEIEILLERALLLRREVRQAVPEQRVSAQQLGLTFRTSPQRESQKR